MIDLNKDKFNYLSKISLPKGQIVSNQKKKQFNKEIVSIIILRRDQRSR